MSLSGLLISPLLGPGLTGRLGLSPPDTLRSPLPGLGTTGLGRLANAVPGERGTPAGEWLLARDGEPDGGTRLVEGERETAVEWVDNLGGDAVSAKGEGGAAAI